MSNMAGTSGTRMDWRLTDKRAKDASKWYVSVFNIEDWVLRFDFSDDPPDWAKDVEDAAISVGMCQSLRRQKKADIWVSYKRCKRFDVLWLRALFHELWHVVMSDVGVESNESSPVAYETVWDRLDGPIHIAYLAGFTPDP